MARPLTLEEVARRKKRREEREARDLKEKKVRAPRGRRPRRPANKHMANNIRELWGSCPNFDAFVVGTGTSLAGFDFTRLNDRPRTVVIGLNDALKAPGFVPDFSLFCDVGIWVRYRDLDLDPKTRMVCQPKARAQFLRWEDCRFKDRIYHFNHVGVINGCNAENDDLFVARTVATGGIMMAWKLGARRVFLLGVDGYKLHGDEGGVYYHDGTGKGSERRKEVPIGEGRLRQDRHEWWAKNMRELRDWFDARGIYQEPWRGRNVYNLSGHSTIDAWQKLKVKTVLGRPR